MSKKRKVKINLDELSAAFEIQMMEVSNYLDLETGEVVIVTDEARRELEDIYDEIYDEEGNRVISLEAYLQKRDDLQDWFKEFLLGVDQVELGYGTRFISVEPDDPHEDYRDMERFIGQVENDWLRERLWDAIQGRGAFRRFKDLLRRHPDVEEHWFTFKADRIEQRMLDWLEYHDIEPILSDSDGEEETN
jgi:hypothetical protein